MRDLDALVRQDIAVKLGGVVYTLPGSIKVKDQLRLAACGETPNAENMGRASEIVWEIIKAKNPEADKEKFFDSLTFEIFARLLVLLSGQNELEAGSETKNVSGAQRLDQ